MRATVLLFLLVQVIVTPIANAASVRAYYRQESIWMAGSLIVDDKAYSPYFFTGYDLTQAMKSNPEAVEYAERASTQHAIGTSLMLGGLAGALGYSFATVGNHNWNGGVYWLIFLAGFLPGTFFEAASAINLNKAINAYNGISSRYTRIKPDKLMLIPNNDGAVAALRWSF